MVTPSELDGIQVSVCVTSFSAHRADLLKSLMRSLEAQSGDYKAEIIVLIEGDISSHSEMQSYLSTCNIPSTLRFLDRPVGVSEGRNMCAKYAKGDIISFLDDDTIASFSWLERLYEFFKEQPEAKVLGGPVRPSWLGEAPSYLGEDMYWLLGCTPYSKETEVTAATNAIGSNISVKRDVFEAVGGFNESVGFSIAKSRSLIGGEDLDLCLRIQRMFPNSVYFNPDIQVYHQIPPTKWKNDRLFKRAFFYGFGNAFISSSHGVSPTHTGYLLIVLRQGFSDIFRSFKRNALRGAILVCIVSGFVYFALMRLKKSILRPFSKMAD